MKLKFIIPFLLSAAYGCNGTQNNVAEKKVDSLHSTAATDTLSNQILTVSDTTDDSQFHQELTSIRENYRRINSIQKWSSVTTIDLNDESTEGGEARYYYSNGTLQKIATWHFGEIFQKTTEYYLLENRLSFVFEKIFKYNRPITYDSADMQTHGDTAVFDIKKAVIIERRYYFKEGKLIYRIGNRKPAAPLSKDVLQDEEKNLKGSFESLTKAVKS